MEPLLHRTSPPLPQRAQRALRAGPSPARAGRPLMVGGQLVPAETPSPGCRVLLRI